MKISCSSGKCKTFQTAENSFPENARSYDGRREEFSCNYSGIFIKNQYNRYYRKYQKNNQQIAANSKIGTNLSGKPLKPPRFP